VPAIVSEVNEGEEPVMPTSCGQNFMLSLIIIFFTFQKFRKARVRPTDG
jgi:hypothetical protein